MKIKSTIALVILATGLAVGARGNDTIATADTALIGETLNWAIFPARDVDHARYVVTARGTFRAWTTGSLDTVGMILDSTGRVLVAGDDVGCDRNFSISAAVIALSHFT